MKYKLHHKEEVDEGVIRRYAVSGGWLYFHSGSSSSPGSWGWGRAAMTFIPDPSVEIEEGVK